MTDAPTIGVVGSADVATALTSMGFHVITGAEFRATATDISQRLKAGASFPIVVADDKDTPALAPWTISTAARTHLVVLGTQPGSGLMAGQPNRLELPATVNELLAALRYQATARPIGKHVIGQDGSVADGAPTPKATPQPLPLPLPEPAPAEAVYEDLDEDDDVTTVDEVHVPVVTPSAPADPAPPASATQGFPEDLFVAAEQHAHTGHQAPITPAPTPAVQEQAPTPTVMLPPAPAQTPDPALDEFDELEYQTGPVAPARQAAHFDVPDVTERDEPVVAEHAPDWQNPPTRRSRRQPIDSPPEHLDPRYNQPEPPAPQTPPVIAPVPPDVPAWRQQSPQTPPVRDEDFFARRAATNQAAAATTGSPTIRGRMGQVIVSAAGKGGVGKSVTAITLADTAAAAGLSAVLVDANRGQADLRKYLRLGDAPLRTAFDAYSTGDPSQAVLRPNDYGHLRQAAKLDIPDFAIVLGPPRDQADPQYASAQVYGQIIDYARSIADLVIVDTQIVESHRTDLWDQLLVPALRSDAWLVGITDESSPGVSNLLDRLGELQEAGVPNARTLVLATQYENFTDEDAVYFQARFASLGTLIGATGMDPNFHDQMNMGRIVSNSPAIAPSTRAILQRVTGRADLFADPAEAPRDRKPRRRLFGRR